MNEPTIAAGITAFAATLSAVSLTLLGVDYYAIVWGLLGALSKLALTHEQTTSLRACLAVGASTVLAAGMAHVLADAVSATGSGTRGALVSSALLIGFGAQIFVAQAVEAIAARIQRFGEGGS